MKCQTCKGRGRWQARETKAGETELVWQECLDCGGTGQADNESAGDVFDVGENEDD